MSKEPFNRLDLIESEDQNLMTSDDHLRNDASETIAMVSIVSIVVIRFACIPMRIFLWL